MGRRTWVGWRSCVKCTSDDIHEPKCADSVQPCHNIRRPDINVWWVGELGYNPSHPSSSSSIGVSVQGPVTLKCECVCMYVMYVHMYVMYVHMYVYYVCMLCMYICMYVMYVHMYVHMYVCYVCTYACYVCMCVYAMNVYAMYVCMHVPPSLGMKTK